MRSAAARGNTCMHVISSCSAIVTFSGMFVLKQMVHHHATWATDLIQDT